MDFLSGIEKMINVHEATTPLQKQILIMHNHFAALEAMNKSLEVKISVLEREKTDCEMTIKRLTLELNHTQKRIRRLNENLSRILALNPESDVRTQSVSRNTPVPIDFKLPS